MKRKKTRVKNPPTLGPWVCKWIESFLVHSEGDYLGRPFKLIDFHRRFIWRAYELNPDGTRRYHRALLGLPKGNAKTEIAAALAVAELAGPVVCGGWKNGKPVGAPRLSPNIPVAAASFDQANTLFRAAKAMISGGPLEPYFDCFDTQIIPKTGAGLMYRIAAEAGTNDGKKPSFFVADELHEWEGRKERVHLVMSNNRAKRTDSWELAISTAGWNINSLLGRMYKHGKRVNEGEEEDPSFLMVWSEPSRDYDLSDPDERRAAVLETNPAAGVFLSTEQILQRYNEIPEYEWRRYYLNQWTDSPDRWLPLGAWESLAAKKQVPEGTRIVIGFDGSYAGDSTAIYGCTLEEVPHLFVIGAWERPEMGGKDWRVSIADVENTLKLACIKWKVESIGCDPYRWQRTIDALKEEGLPIIDWPSHSAARMVTACAQFYDAVIDKELTHDGDPRTDKHMSNCIVKIDSRGPRISKDHKNSEKHIDLSVAAVIAKDLHGRFLNSRAVEPKLRWVG